MIFKIRNTAKKNNPCVIPFVMVIVILREYKKGETSGIISPVRTKNMGKQKKKKLTRIIKARLITINNK
ncbi:MAG: hypothetical protein ACFFC6_17500, partial [Promethearchaeota archaeon]